jgi:hypothetical protein
MRRRLGGPQGGPNQVLQQTAGACRLFVTCSSPGPAAAELCHWAAEGATVSVELNVVGVTTINFDDDTRRWIQVKRFAWHGSAEDAGLLAALVEHPDYMDTNPAEADARHGPYDVSAIHPATFEGIEPARVATLVEDFYAVYARHGYGEHKPPAAAFRSRVDTAIIDPLSRTKCYRLCDLPEAVVDGGVFLDFQELVGIDRSDRILLLAMFGAEL